MPPKLNRPWNPDIIVRPDARSTMIAWMFMATSTAPIAAPNASSAGTSTATLDAVASTGSIAVISSVATTITVRQPARADHSPASGIVIIEPAPRHSSSRPSVASSRPARDFANGTSGAHADMPMPAMRNTMRVPCCSTRPGSGY